MKNKGFTLAELVAVIAVISLVMIIAIPAVENALLHAKKNISALNKKNIKDAAEMYAEAIIFCDKDTIKEFASCSDAKNNLNGGIDVEISKLKELGYFGDRANKCSGSIIVRADILSDNATNNVTVEYTDPDGNNTVECEA